MQTRNMNERRLAAGLILLAWLIVFGPVLLSDDGLFYRDQLITTLPARAYLHARLRAFELPQWFPYEGLGVPYIGQIATNHFHPGLWAFVWMTPV